MQNSCSLSDESLFLGFFTTNNSCLETNSLAAVCPASGFILKALHVCICVKAEANKLNKEGETWITLVVKSNANVLSADSSKVSCNIVL